MKAKLLGLLLLILPLLALSTKVRAERMVEEKPLQMQIESKRLDNDAKILSKYLAQYNSPLQYHSQDFIDAASKYNLDWKLLPAISGVESTFGKQIPGGYNGWGWGVYGTQAIYFDSWKEAIFTVARGLRENYLNKGLTDPYSMNRAYAASPYWGWKVAYFMNDLERFANTNKQAKIGLNPAIAAISGRLILR